MEQQNIKENVVDLVNDLKAYATLRANLVSLQIKKLSAELISSIGSNLIVIIFASFVFVFGSFALAYFIGEKYNSLFIGFISVTGIYFFLLILALLLRNTIKNYISNTIISTLFKEEEHEDDKE